MRLGRRLHSVRDGALPLRKYLWEQLGGNPIARELCRVKLAAKSAPAGVLCDSESEAQIVQPVALCKQARR